MNKYLLSFLFCISLSVQAFAAKISGVVTDASNGTPLQGVLVVIKELNRPVETDDSGRYEFTDVPGGSYEVLFNFLTYKQVLQTVSIINNKDVVLDIRMKPDGNTLKDVTVKAAKTTNTENAVLMEVRKSNMVVSGVSAAQIQKTADRNAADVVKRVPGVTIIDDKFIMVRGLIDRYNSVWLNNAGAPSSEVDKKSFSFDLIPAGAIDRILVYKTPSPELPGDFAGGMVKIFTTGLPDRNQVSVGFQASYRQYSTGKPFYYNEPSSTDWLGYDDGRRSLPANTPEYINKNDSNSNELTKAFSKNDWIIKTKKTAPDYRFNLNVANVFAVGKVKIGNAFALGYSNQNADSLIRRKYAEDSTGSSYDYLDYRSVNSVNATIMDNLVAVFGNSKIEFKNLYNQNGKSTVTIREEADTMFADELAYSIGYESRAVYTSQLMGTHKTRSGKTNYNWTLGYTDLFKNVPDLRRVRYTRAQGDDTADYFAAIANQVDPVNGGGRFYSELYEDVYSFSHHFSQKIRLFNYEFEASVGNYVEYKSRFFNARVLGYTLRSLQNPDKFRLLALPINEIFADSNVGDVKKFRIDETTNGYDRYDAKNQLLASFVSLNLPIGDKINIVGGTRYEYNIQELRSIKNTDTLHPKVPTKFWLPSVNAAYNYSDKALVRVAYGKTLNRPEFREWSPFFFYDFDTREGVYGALFETLTNPKGDTLDVAVINNVDARWEWYSGNGEMIHAGAFYKRIKKPIQKIIDREGSDSRLLTFINADEAYSAGVEVEFRKSLSFADKWLNTSAFSDIYVVGNATFIKSEMTIADTMMQINKTPLQGQSPYMFNAGVFYDNEKKGFQSSVLYNVFGPRMVALGSRAIPNIGELPFHSLDFALTKSFFKHYMLTLSAQNILNSSNTLVQDMNRDGKFVNDDVNDRLFSTKKPGRYYSVGVKVKF